MIYEELEEETCSKTTNITTDMCEYKDDESNKNEDQDQDHKEAEKDTANLNKEIQ